MRVKERSAIVFGAAALALFAAACAVPREAARPPETPAVHADTERAEGSPLGVDWIFVNVEGYDGPLPSPPPVAGFIMTADGERVTGTTACNRLGAGYDLDARAGALRFRNLRNTRMMCDRVAADTEEAVLQAMIATDAYRVRDGLLELLSKGRVVARLKAGNR